MVASVLRYGPFFRMQKQANMAKTSSPSLLVRVLRKILKTPSILGFLAGGRHGDGVPGVGAPEAKWIPGPAEDWEVS